LLFADARAGYRGGGMHAGVEVPTMRERWLGSRWLVPAALAVPLLVMVAACAA